jgi:hypothetical protein
LGKYAARRTSAGSAANDNRVEAHDAEEMSKEWCTILSCKDATRSVEAFDNVIALCNHRGAPANRLPIRLQRVSELLDGAKKVQFTATASGSYKGLATPLPA